jgi:hypothetical protein
MARWSVCKVLIIGLVMQTMSGTVRALAQDSTAASFRLLGHHDEITLLTGYHQGRYGFAEIGLGRSIYGLKHHPYGMGYHIGSEVRVDRPDIWGLKAGAYVTGGFAMGIQYVHYMRADDAMEVLRLECGIGVLKARMVYAYNMRLSKPELEGVNTHMLTLSYAFRVKRLPHDDARMGRP